MRISQDGIELIKMLEGLRLEAYKCAGEVWTIGYGHCGRGVAAGMKITLKQAEDLLLDDIAKFELAVNRQVKVALNQHQFDALVSWCYNLGETNLANSTMLTKLNAGDYAAVPAEMQRWNKAGGKVVFGLVQRRELEAELFTTPYREVYKPMALKS